MSRQAAGRRFPMPSLRSGPQIVAVLLLIGLLFAMATKPWMQLTAQKERLEEMAGDLTKVERENAELEARIERYKDPDFIEQKAREQAGLVRPGEIPYVVMPPSDKRVRDKPASTEKPVVEPPEDKNVVQRFLEFAGLG